MHTKLPFLSLLILFSLVISPLGLTAAQAAGPYYVQPAAAGAGDCSSWANACPLQTALSAAASGEEIWVAAGVYTPGSTVTATFQLKNDVALYGGFAGGETARSQRDPVHNVSVLSGDIEGNDVTDAHGVVTNSADIVGANAYHVLTAGSGVTSSAVLDGFTVTGGKADAEDEPDYYGGGLYNHNSSPSLSNVTFSGNNAWNGAGIYNSNSSPTLENVTFSGNHAQNGGGIANLSSSPVLTGVTFSGNTADGQGGGLYINSGNPTLTNVTFIENWAAYGSAITNVDGSPTLTVVALSSLSGSNSIVENAGGSPTLTNVTISGVINSVSSHLALTNVTLNGTLRLTNDSPTIRNSIVWGGDGIVNAYGSNAPVIANSIVQGGCPAGGSCTQVTSADPHLGVIGAYPCPEGLCSGGGLDLSIPLLPGSPAIDAGNDAFCADTDQRGVARPRGAHCDIGAYESNGFTLAVRGGDQQSALLYNSFAQPLSLALNETGGSRLPGATFAFTAPLSGPGASFSTATVITDASGSASDTATANGIPGSYVVTATAPGSDIHATFHLTNTANTLTMVSPAPNPATYGQTVTFTAALSVLAPPDGVPTGSVAFKDNGTLIPGCSEQAVDGSGQATCATAALAAGSHSIRAEYSGDGIYNPSSVIYPLTVNPAPTTTTITSSSNPSTPGNGVTFNVTVASPNGVPTGTVEFYETTSLTAQAAGAPAASVQPLLDGVATYTAASLGPGTHTLLAIYHGDGNFSASISEQYEQVVTSTPGTHWVFLPLVQNP